MDSPIPGSTRSTNCTYPIGELDPGKLPLLARHATETRRAAPIEINAIDHAPRTAPALVPTPSWGASGAHTRSATALAFPDTTVTVRFVVVDVHVDPGPARTATKRELSAVPDPGSEYACTYTVPVEALVRANANRPGVAPGADRTEIPADRPLKLSSPSVAPGADGRPFLLVSGSGVAPGADRPPIPTDRPLKLSSPSLSGSGVAPGADRPLKLSSPSLSGSGVAPGADRPLKLSSPSLSGSGVAPGADGPPIPTDRSLKLSSPSLSGSGVAPGADRPLKLSSPSLSGSGVAPGADGRPPSLSGSGVAPGADRPPIPTDRSPPRLSRRGVARGARFTSIPADPRYEIAYRTATSSGTLPITKRVRWSRSAGHGAELQYVSRAALSASEGTRSTNSPWTAPTSFTCRAEIVTPSGSPDPSQSGTPSLDPVAYPRSIECGKLNRTTPFADPITSEASPYSSTFSPVSPKSEDACPSPMLCLRRPPSSISPQPRGTPRIQPTPPKPNPNQPQPPSTPPSRPPAKSTTPNQPHHSTPTEGAHQPHPLQAKGRTHPSSCAMMLADDVRIHAYIPGKYATPAHVHPEAKGRNVTTWSNHHGATEAGTSDPLKFRGPDPVRASQLPRIVLV